MQIWVNDLYAVQDALTAERMIAQLGFPLPAEWPRVNSLFNPLGQQPARGYFLLLRDQLDKMGVNNVHTLTFADDDGNSITCRELIISKDPQCLTTGVASDPAALYLVEFSDCRHLLNDPYLGITLNKSYNWRAPAFGGAYYADSLSGGSTTWTWSTMAQDIWDTLGILGDWPSLPITPNAPPENWIFPGVNGYHALNQILHRIGCAIKWQPEESTSAKYTIVQVGATDGNAVQTMDAAETAGRLIYSRDYIAVAQGKVPRKVRVCFHRQQSDYGTEETTPQIASEQFITNSVYTVDVTGPDTTNTNSNTIATIWDDLPALYDAANAISNAAACSTRATERADDFYRMLRQDGGDRLHKVYSGLVKDLLTGSSIKGLTWRQDLMGFAGNPGGLVTEVINHPHAMLKINEHASHVLDCWTSVAITPPDYRPTFPVYPHLLQRINISSGTADGNGNFTATVQKYNPSTRAWSNEENCYGQEINGLTTVATGRYSARLAGYDTDRPVYTFAAGSGSGAGSYGITVREDDGSPSYSNVTILELNQATNLSLSQDAAGEAKAAWDGVDVEKDGSAIGTRRILNHITGTNQRMTLTVADDGTEIDITRDYTEPNSGYGMASNDTTTSTSYTNLAGIGSVSFTTTVDNADVVVNFHGSLSVDQAGDTVDFRIQIGGTTAGRDPVATEVMEDTLEKTIIGFSAGTVNASGNFNIGVAGTYTINVQWKVSGSGTPGATLDDYHLRVHEMGDS